MEFPPHNHCPTDHTQKITYSSGTRYTSAGFTVCAQIHHTSHLLTVLSCAHRWHEITLRLSCTERHWFEKHFYCYLSKYYCELAESTLDIQDLASFNVWWLLFFLEKNTRSVETYPASHQPENKRRVWVKVWRARGRSSSSLQNNSPWHWAGREMLC